MATSGVEANAERLLGAFYDLSGGKLTEPVSLGGPEMPAEGAAPRADLDPDSTECAVAARYLVDQGYIAPADAASGYVITVAGFDRVREMRGIGSPAAPAGRSGMSDKTQKQLVTLLSIAISIGLSQPLARFIQKEIPERRGIRDDLTEAVLKGLVRAVALVVASVIVRKLAASRR
ncbi:MAG: hypothetical protein M3254_02745 [Actinomycetota bacterium]|nr:hypothetical protein [Actinomycetota bacterium]